MENEEATANHVKVRDVNWCLDSGVNNHMVSYEAFFYEFTEYIGKGCKVKNN